MRRIESKLLCGLLATGAMGVTVGALPARIAVAAPGTDAPLADCLGASNASIRFDNEHRLRAERAELLICAAAGCPVEIRNECIRRVDEINAAIPTVIFGVKDGEGNDLSAVKVTMDRELLTDRLQGLAISIDPGVHMFSFEVSGQPTLHKQYVIRQGQKNRTELISLEPPSPANLATVGGPGLLAKTSSSSSDGAPSDAATAVAPASRSTSASYATSTRFSGAPPGSDEGEPMSVQKKLALGATAVGVVGLGLGTVFGLQARAKRDDARAVCSTPTCPTPDGATLWRQAKNVGNLATGAFIAGGVGLAAAMVLWLTAPVHARLTTTAEVRDGGMSLALAGRW